MRRVIVYNAAGQWVGTAKAGIGTTSVNTSLGSGDVAVVKIGEKAIKVLLK